MPAFRRRTLFAAPLILSVASGCSKPEKTGGVNPPEPGSSTRHTVNPPAPLPLKVRWQVTRDSTGACEADENVQCAPGVKCNPPPPRPIACPAGITQDGVTVAERPDKTCAIVPAGCDSTECATQATPCPK